MRQCLEQDAEHLEARLNLGRLLHLEGDCATRSKVYRGADAARCAAVVQPRGAARGSGARIGGHVGLPRGIWRSTPDFADAHFNLARLYERKGKSKDALRHLLAYRRLMNAAMSALGDEQRTLLHVRVGACKRDPSRGGCPRPK